MSRFAFDRVGTVPMLKKRAHLDLRAEYRYNPLMLSGMTPPASGWANGASSPLRYYEFQNTGNSCRA